MDERRKRLNMWEDEISIWSWLGLIFMGTTSIAMVFLVIWTFFL